MDHQLEDILEQCKRNPNLDLKEIASLQKLLSQAIKICKRSSPPPTIPCFDPLQMPNDVEPMEVD